MIDLRFQPTSLERRERVQNCIFVVNEGYMEKLGESYTTAGLEAEDAESSWDDDELGLRSMSTYSDKTQVRKPSGTWVGHPRRS